MGRTQTRAGDGHGTDGRSRPGVEPPAIPRARQGDKPSAADEQAQDSSGASTPRQRQPPSSVEASGTDDGDDQRAGPDHPGFHEYVASRGRALLRTAYLLTGNTADAEDLVQSALAKTYLAWDRITDRGALDGYVRRAIVNTHISWWRRRRLEEFPTDEIPDQAVDDHTGTSDLQASLRMAIDRLPQRMRAAVVLRFFEDMTEPEVAEALGVSLGTVKSTVSRAVAKLRAEVDLR